MGQPAVVSTPPARQGLVTLTAHELGREFASHMRVLVFAGIPVGVLVGGIVSRLAMFILRLTSPERVRGIKSDDGFRIGDFTLGGTYNLLMVGAAVGLIGACAYRLVAPWLVGPTWFRYVTVGLASGCVGGAILVHDSGIDFHLLEPTWLAIGLFVAVPGLFGLLIGPALDRVVRNEKSLGGGRRSLVAIGLAAVFPPALFVLAFVTPVTWVAIGLMERLRSSRLARLAFRGAWLAIALGGLWALIRDVGQIA